MDSTLGTAPTGYRRLFLGGNTCVYIADILGPFILICYQIINMFIISYLVKSSGILYQVARASMLYNLVTTITRIVNYRVDVWASRLASSLLPSERARITYLVSYLWLRFAIYFGIIWLTNFNNKINGKKLINLLSLRNPMTSNAMRHKHVGICYFWKSLRAGAGSSNTGWLNSI